MSPLGKLWRGWLKFATVVGNVQMIVLLSLVYWVMVTMVALPLRLFTDPLGLKKAPRGNWLKRPPVSDTFTAMKKQG